jgi:hypothetical protein
MTLEAELEAFAIAVGTDVKTLLAAVDALEGATGGSVDLDLLTDVVLTGPTTAHLLRHNGTNWVNVLGTTYFDAAGSAASAQSASQPLDSDLTSIAALTTTTYGRALLELANQAALMTLIAAATDTVAGAVELATPVESQTGLDTARAVTPAGLKAAIDDAKAAILGAGVPSALDTLDELAAALGDDANFAATVTTSLSGKQPLDSDLTAIAALTTTTYGRAFLALADQAALMALVAAASETVPGKIEISTQAETDTGTDDVRAVTPLKLQTRIAALFGDPNTDLAAVYTTARDS